MPPQNGASLCPLFLDRILVYFWTTHLSFMCSDTILDKHEVLSQNQLVTIGVTHVSYEDRKFFPFFQYEILEKTVTNDESYFVKIHLYIHVKKK